MTEQEARKDRQHEDLKLWLMGARKYHLEHLVIAIDPAAQRSHMQYSRAIAWALNELESAE